MSDLSLLSGVKRKSGLGVVRSGFDPNRTSAEQVTEEYSKAAWGARSSALSSPCLGIVHVSRASPTSSFGRRFRRRTTPTPNAVDDAEANGEECCRKQIS
jgi:hypothetical protein